MRCLSRCCFKIKSTNYLKLLNVLDWLHVWPCLGSENVVHLSDLKKNPYSVVYIYILNTWRPLSILNHNLLHGHFTYFLLALQQLCTNYLRYGT